MVLTAFGRRFKKLRESVNLSQEQIQYAVGIGQAYLSKLESGEVNIGLSHISALAEFFGLEDFKLLQYESPLPDSDELRKNVNRYILRKGISPDVFLKKGLTHLLKDKVLQSKFLTSPKYNREIADMLLEKHSIKFSTTAISQALENLRKKGLIEKLRTDKKSKFQYRKKMKP